MKRNLLAAFAALALSLAPAAAADMAVDGNLRLSCGTATAAAGAATLANKCGVVTTEALTTAAGDTPYTLTLTNTVVVAADVCLASVANGTSTTGVPLTGRVTPAAGSLVITVYNKHASAALNGTLLITYLCIKP